MRISIISQTEHPARTCAAAAWCCTHEEPRTADDFTFTQASELVERVISYGHESIAEHASFTVLVEGISRACSHQLVRSRIASYSQKSQRYVEIDTDNDDWYVTPPNISIREAYSFFYDVMKTAATQYNELIEAGIPAEDARYVLPSAACTNITITMNARAWWKFLNQRLCKKAQWEIREMAQMIYSALYQAAPALFQQKLPKCGSKGECKSCKGLN